MKAQLMTRIGLVKTLFRLPGEKISFARLKESMLRVHECATNTERFLILFAALSGAFFMFFEPYPPSDFFARFEPKRLFWQVLFFSAVGFHFTVLYLESARWRKFSCLIYAVIWLAFFLLAITAAMPTMATPLTFGLFSMGFYEAARIQLKENE